MIWLSIIYFLGVIAVAGCALIIEVIDMGENQEYESMDSSDLRQLFFFALFSWLVFFIAVVLAIQELCAQKRRETKNVKP